MCYIGCFVIINCVRVHYTAPLANLMCHFEMIPDSSGNVLVSGGVGRALVFAHSVFASLWIWELYLDSIGSDGSIEVSIIQIDQWIPKMWLSLTCRG